MKEKENIRVLIVEDQALVSELIQGILEEAGYTIVGLATDGQQAIEMTAQLEPDVILMDIEIPIVDGLEATKAIQECCPTPVVMLSAHESGELVKQAGEAGAGAYLIKPATAQEMQRAITIARARFSDMMTLRALNTTLSAHVQRQEALARLGRHALASSDPDILFTEAASLIAAVLHARLCEVRRYLRDKHQLQLEARVGTGKKGKSTLAVDEATIEGRAFLGGEPQITTGLHAAKGVPAAQGLSVVIPGGKTPFGVLSVYTNGEATFTQDELHFAQAMANVLAQAIQRERAEASLRNASEVLEKQVLARTQALSAANEQLQQEIAEREQAEQALKKAHDQLETRVAERTAELAKANEELRFEVSERQRAEEAAHEAHERLDATLNALPDLLIEIDRYGRIYDFRPPRSEQKLIPQQEFLGQSIEEIFPKDAAAVIMQAVDQAVQLGQPTSAVYTVETPVMAGWFELSIATKGDPHTPDGRLVVLIRDITERINTEQTLRESETRYRLTIDAIKDMIHVVDRNLRLTLVNATLQQRICDLGLEESAIGKNVFEAFPFLPESVREEYQQVFQSGEALFTEEANWIDDQRIITETRKIPIVERDHVTSVVTVMHDITERKLAEKMLRESEEQLRMVVQNMPVMMDAFDAQEQILVWNRECERVTGYQEDEIVGNPHALALLYPDPDYRERVTKEAVEHGYNFRNVEWKITCKDGTVKTIAWSNISKQVPIPGWHTWSIGVDVTQREEAEQALRYRLAMEELVATISTRFITITQGQFEEEVKRALQDIGELTEVDKSYIYLLSPHKLVVRQAFEWYREGIAMLETPPAALRKWTLEKLKNFEPLLISDVADLPPEAAEDKRRWQQQAIRSLLAIPLVMNNELAGVLGLASVKTEKTWTEENVRLLKLVGDVFVNALVRQQAEMALHQRRLELDLFSRLSQALATTLDLDKVLITLLEEVKRLLGVIACSVWLVDPETETITCRQATGVRNEYVRGWRISMGEGIVGWVARHGESLVVPDVETDKRHFKGVDQKTELPLRSILSVPLRVKQRIIGVIQVVDTEVNRFSTADLRLMEPLAATAAITIENARLYEQAQQDARAKAMLLDETNHRVKNNLAAILGILALELQQPYTEVADFRATLRDLQSRIQGMTTVHNLLSDAQWAPLPLDKLVTEIIHVALGGSPIRHRIKVHVAAPERPILIAPKQATGLAIIINELTTNSIKYAFKERNEGSLVIEIDKEEAENQVTIEFHDDGPGWPEDVLRGERENVGLHLIRMNVRSPLRGQIALSNDNGATATLTFKPAPINQNRA